MRLLLLAPQPFYQERGTPIAVKLALEVLVDLLPKLIGEPVRIDLLTYHEGSPLHLVGVNHERIKTPLGLGALLRRVGPGISLKKLICDLLFLISAIRLVWRNRKDQFTVIHAVEESVFIALLVKWLFKIPYVYDMDSSLALQVTEKWWALKPIAPFLNWAERKAVKNSLAVAPVCDALAEIADRHGSAYTRIIRDISLLDLEAERNTVTLKQELALPEGAKILLYVGNLEHYQGIDLLIEGFAEAAPSLPGLHVVIIGGVPQHVSAYREKARLANLSHQVHLLGPRPIDELDSYLLEADFLVSPRTKGNNTPMKIYSYLHSGKPILATDLPTHTQVLDETTAVLFEPFASAFSRALLELCSSPAQQAEVGRRARILAEERYTRLAFVRELEALYRVVVGNPSKLVHSDDSTSEGSLRRAVS